MNNVAKFADSRSSNFSDDVIRRFLLGQLNSLEQLRFEERLFTDEELGERVRLAEFALSDDYACRHLNAHQRELFRRKFLASRDRRVAFNVSMALHRRFVMKAESNLRGGFFQTVQSAFDLKQAAWKYAFAALILIILIATIWVGTKRPQIVQRLVPLRSSPKTAVTPTPGAAHHAAPATPVHREPPAMLPAHEAPAQTLVLNPTSVMEPVPLNLPNTKTGFVRFQIVNPEKFQGTFQAEVLTISGESALKAASLKALDNHPNVIEMDVPAPLLRSGPYQIVLKGINRSNKREVINYYFKVQ